ncbi:MAG: hypothetical protein J6T10_30755 [Methanobrevibacter sp.]|nr:hypothetical protein [Methanobrevibacter sp.]
MRRKNVRPDNLKFIDSALSNDDTYFDYLRRMKMVALSMFEWKLPKGMDSRYLERSLYYKGMATMFETPEFGFINTQCSTNGYLNIYGLPSALMCNTFNGLHWYKKLFTQLGEDEETIKKQREEECIFVMNDWEGMPTAFTIEQFAYRMYLAQRTADVNMSAQRTPVMVVCSDKQRLTMENLYSQYDGNQPFIFGDKDSNINENSLKSLKTDAPFICDKVIDYKKEIWNEFLQFLGVNSISIEKKERLITDEANQNNEVINLYLQSRLAPRQKACDQFNELYGLTGDDKIEVRVRSDLHNIIKNAESVILDEKEKLLENEITESGDLDE